MNYLKKRIKGAVKKVGGVDDEDVEDDAYERQLALAAAAEAGLSHAIPPPNALPPAPIILPPKGELQFEFPQSSTNTTSDEPVEKKHKKKHKNKGQKVESPLGPIPLSQLPTETDAGEPRLQVNKDTEEWKFFEQLTQRVQSTVQQTQTTLSKIKETSAIPEIIKKLEEEDKPIFLEEPPEELSKPGISPKVEDKTSTDISPVLDTDPWPTSTLNFPAKLNWVNFADSDESESDPKKKQHSPIRALPPTATKTPSPLSESKSIANEFQPAERPISLLDDFGFSEPDPVKTESLAGVAPTLDIGFVSDEEEDETGLDPFDTTFVDLKVPANTCVSNTPCNEILESEEVEEEDDPFDTAQAERVIRRSESYLSNVSRLTSPGEDMSNPFVFDDIAAAKPPGAPTPGESLFSSTDVSPVDMPEDVANFFTNCSRRSSTNPFDAEEINFLREKVNAVAADKAGVDTVKSGAALLEAIANEFAGKDKEDDDLFAATIGRGKNDIPSPLTPVDPFGDQIVPQAASSSEGFNVFGDSESTQPNKIQDASSRFENTNSGTDLFGSSAFDAPKPAPQPTSFASVFGDAFGSAPIEPQSAVNKDLLGVFDEPMSTNTDTYVEEPKISEPMMSPTESKEASVPTIANNPMSPPSDAFQAAFGKKSIDFDDIPDDAKTPVQAAPSSSFDPFSGISNNLPLPTNIPGPASAVGSPLDELKTEEPAVAMEITEEVTSGVSEVLQGLSNVPVFTETVAPTPPRRESLCETPEKQDFFSTDTPSSFDTPSTTATSAPAQPTTLDVFGDSHHIVDDKTPSVDVFGSFNSTNKDLFGDISMDTTSSGPFDTNMSLGPDPFDTTNISLEAVQNAVPYSNTEAFEAFASKFEKAGDNIDSTLGGLDAFGAPSSASSSKATGFEGMDFFDPFAAPTKAPQNTPAKPPLGSMQQESKDSFDDDDEGTSFAVVIKPKMRDGSKTTEGAAKLGPPPKLLPPPKSPVRTAQSGGEEYVSTLSKKLGSARGALNDDDLFLNFESETAASKQKSPDEFAMFETDTGLPPALGESGAKQAAEAESPSTPLFDEDTSQPLEPFLKKFECDGWEFLIRHPNKKKITAQRFWKPVYVRMTDQNIIYIYNKKEDNDPFQEFPLQGCYSVSEAGAQQFDAYSKIFTVKLQYIFYKERVGVRPGQVAKVMQGQITSMGQIAKLGLPLEHAPQVTELLKLGTQKMEDIKTFTTAVEEALFRLNVHRDRALTYKTEEIQVTVYDEFYVEQDHTGHVNLQKARVRLFCLAFLNGMPDVEIGVNDMRRQGKEVVGRYDIMPIITEEWIRLEECELHACVSQADFEESQIIKVHPPDAMQFEMMRFRIRPPKRRELPIQIKAVLRVAPPKVELRADVLVPGFSSRKHGQVPCEDVSIKFPIPECWVYFFRVEKHFRYGALKSASRRPGKIKGLERIMGSAGQNLEQHHLIEASAGVAKYEHAHRAIVWRIPRLPKEGQGAYTQQLMVLRLNLTNFDQIPSSFEDIINVEFTMPASTVSHCVVRSISANTEEPPEKFVRYVARHEYQVGMEVIVGSSDSDLIKDATSGLGSHANGSPPQAPTPQSQHADDDSD